MTSQKYIYIIAILIALFSANAKAELAVPSAKTQINKAQDILIGSFEIGDNGRIYFVADEILKGNLMEQAKLLVDKDSNLAVVHLKGGGIRPLSELEFNSMITKKEWFKEKVIILGEARNGAWYSFAYDWSIWPRNIPQLKNLELKDCKDLIREALHKK